MGKLIRIKTGFSNVWLPNGYSYDGGDECTLSDAQYNSLDLDFRTRTLTVLDGGVADPPPPDDGGGGEAGPQGPAGPAGDSAYEVAVANGFVGNEAAWLASLVGPAGADGQDGADGAAGAAGAPGVGVPTGGSAGQVLAKASGTNYDTEWIDPPAGGGASGAVWVG